MNVPMVNATQVPDDAYLLDVRDDDEWAAGHAAQAVHVPMMEISARFAELPADQEIVVVCRVGGRSAQVVAFLRQQGLDRVSNLDGGMLAWHAAGRPVVTTDGGDGFVL